MHIITLFENFENNVSEKEQLMGTFLHLYGSIPLTKEKASQVIKRIVWDTEGRFYVLGEDIIPGHLKPHDKVRFSDYFDSLLKSKDARGHNFEGCLCGLYGGELNTRGGRWDMSIGDKNYSVKFVDKASEKIQLGSYKSLLSEFKDKIEEFGGVGRIFQSDDTELKQSIWSKIVGANQEKPSEVDGWIMAYPVITNGEYDYIQCHLFSFDEISRILLEKKLTVSPKQGWSDLYGLAISEKIFNSRKSGVESTSFKIVIPKVSVEELKSLALSDVETKFSQEILGPLSRKVRPDVLRYIFKNKDSIIKKMSDFSID